MRRLIFLIPLVVCCLDACASLDSGTGMNQSAAAYAVAGTSPACPEFVSRPARTCPTNHP